VHSLLEVLSIVGAESFEVAVKAERDRLRVLGRPGQRVVIELGLRLGLQLRRRVPRWRLWRRRARRRPRVTTRCVVRHAPAHEVNPNVVVAIVTHSLGLTGRIDHRCFERAVAANRLLALSAGVFPVVDPKRNTLTDLTLLDLLLLCQKSPRMRSTKHEK
jgi:hypothetical protein